MILELSSEPLASFEPLLDQIATEVHSEVRAERCDFERVTVLVENYLLASKIERLGRNPLQRHNPPR
jgi:hypothetical protein